MRASSSNQFPEHSRSFSDLLYDLLNDGGEDVKAKVPAWIGFSFLTAAIIVAAILAITSWEMVG